MLKSKEFSKDPPGTPQSLPPGMRLLLLLMIAVCGVLMAFVLVSDPRISSKLQISADYVSSVLKPSDQAVGGTLSRSSGFDEPGFQLIIGPPDPQVFGNKAERPGAGFMPRDIVPVRRGGILFED